MTTCRGSGVSFHELARALRLVDEVRARPRGSVEQRTCFLRGITELVGAQVGIWADVAGMNRGALLLRDTLDVGWHGPRERAVFLTYLQAQSDLPDPTLVRLATIADENFARARHELLDDRDWYRSAHVQEHRKAAGVNHFVLAAWRRGDHAQALSVHRPWGERAFDERERTLIDVVYREAAHLLAAPATLSPRQQAVLDALCRGLAEKEIAAELALSPHTVHGHVKELHRRLGARGRGELLSLALRP
jgi:DNA-binding CsgD family transcriptional regulator